MRIFFKDFTDIPPEDGELYAALDIDALLIDHEIKVYMGRNVALKLSMGDALEWGIRQGHITPRGDSMGRYKCGRCECKMDRLPPLAEVLHHSEGLYEIHLGSFALECVNCKSGIFVVEVGCTAKDAGKS